MAQTRTRTLGPAARPVAVPADLDNPSLPKASGRIELPPHIRWSGQPLTYDLNDRSDRARVYEQVLREGTVDDVRFFVDAERLLELWDELVLPPAVRRAWADWLQRHCRDEQVLSPLQEQIAEIIAGLEEAEDFALAGGAALIARGDVLRQTRASTSSV